MLSYNELILQETILNYGETIPINATAECKPILILNRNNAIIYSNQAAQISFGLNNIANISGMPTSRGWIRISQNDHICPRQRRDWLAHNPPGKQMPITEGI